MFVYVDCASADRICGEAKSFAARSEIKLSIDHHVSNVLFADHNYVNAESSSASELVYDVIDGLVAIDTEMASAIYAGIVCDTGGFRHSSTTPETLDVTARLMRMGIPFTDIYSELCVRHTFAESKVLSKVIDNIQILQDGRLAVSQISINEMNELGSTPKDVDGVVEYLMDISGVEIAVLMYEKKVGEIKCSFRSKDIDVSAIAQIHAGGGHKKAAGCSVFGRIEDITPIIVDELCEILSR